MRMYFKSLCELLVSQHFISDILTWKEADYSDSSLNSSICLLPHSGNPATEVNNDNTPASIEVDNVIDQFTSLIAILVPMVATAVWATVFDARIPAAVTQTLNFSLVKFSLLPKLLYSANFLALLYVYAKEVYDTGMVDMRLVIFLYT